MTQSVINNELMNNKLEVKFVTSENFNGDSPESITDERRASETSGRRGSSAPKIVVCPPMEDISNSPTAPLGGHLLRAITRRLPRRSNDRDSLDSSSSDSSASENNRSDDRSSCSTESSSDGSERQRRHRSTVSLRRVFQSLTLASRSQSCSPTEKRRPPKKQQQPKRLLRPPVPYTYVRGLSGLPTHRIPLHVLNCGSSGLHR